MVSAIDSVNQDVIDSVVGKGNWRETASYAGNAGNSGELILFIVHKKDFWGAGVVVLVYAG